MNPAPARPEASRVRRFPASATRAWHGLFWLVGLTLVAAARATSTNANLLSPSLPDAGTSVLRVFGALICVLALFLAGVWGLKHWPAVWRTGNRPAKLRVVEARPLGHRHTLYVVGYDQQRLLIAASPNGVSLLSALPADPAPPSTSGPPSAPAPAFAPTLEKMLGR